MIKKDRNTSELWQIVCKKFIINIIAFVVFIVWIIIVDPASSEIVRRQEV